MIGPLPGERSCLSLVWASLDRTSRGWRGVTMTPATVRQLQELRRELLGKDAGTQAAARGTQAVAAAPDIIGKEPALVSISP